MHGAYPICTFTWVILPLEPLKATARTTFVNWALTKGQAYGPKLSLPAPTREHPRAGAAQAGTNPPLNSLRSCTVRSTMGTAKRGLA